MKSEFGFLNKIEHIDNGSCIGGIEKIEILNYSEDQIECLIYHDQTFREENPVKHKIENFRKNQH